MTLEYIKNMVADVDPGARRYYTTMEGDAFTVWQEYRELDLMADDVAAEGWAFEIDRYTKVADDPIAIALRERLRSEPLITYTYQIAYEPDTGYIRHIFDCEGC